METWLLQQHSLCTWDLLTLQGWSKLRHKSCLTVLNQPHGTQHAWKVLLALLFVD